MTEQPYFDVGIDGHAPATTLVLWLGCLCLLGCHRQGWRETTDTGPDPRR